MAMSTRTNYAASARFARRFARSQRTMLAGSMPTTFTRDYILGKKDRVILPTPRDRRAA
jgi:hypothetical protein